MDVVVDWGLGELLAINKELLYHLVGQGTTIRLRIFAEREPSVYPLAGYWEHLPVVGPPALSVLDFIHIR